MSLKDRYVALCATPSDIYLHLPKFVAMVEALDATHVIELGTRSGVSTIAWLYALEGRGRLTSVDIEPAPDLGALYGHWSFIQGDDLDPTVISQLEPAEIVFIDTSHHYRQTLAELNTYRWLVRPGGIIVCHDTELERPEDAGRVPRYPVKTAVIEFCGENSYEWANYPECWGLAVIKVG